MGGETRSSDRPGGTAEMTWRRKLIEQTPAKHRTGVEREIARRQGEGALSAPVPPAFSDEDSESDEANLRHKLSNLTINSASPSATSSESKGSRRRFKQSHESGGATGGVPLMAQDEQEQGQEGTSFTGSRQSGGFDGKGGQPSLQSLQSWSTSSSGRTTSDFVSAVDKEQVERLRQEEMRRLAQERDDNRVLTMPFLPLPVKGSSEQGYRAHIANL